MGFDDKWINLNIECISTNPYVVLINGVAYGCIESSNCVKIPLNV